MVSLGLAMVICGLAIRFGESPTRRVGAVLLTAWIVSLVVYRNSLRFADGGVMLIDGFVALFFIWESLRSRRLWTIVVSAFQVLALASHLATVIDYRVTINTYRLSLAVWSYGILLVLALAVWRDWSARRAAADRDDAEP